MVDRIFVFLRQYLIFGRGSGTIYQKIYLSTGWASNFCVTPLFDTFLNCSLNWASFPLLSYSSPLLSPFLSGPLNWALFWAKLLNWALFWANLLVWALFWALKRADILSKMRSKKRSGSARTYLLLYEQNSVMTLAIFQLFLKLVPVLFILVATCSHLCNDTQRRRWESPGPCTQLTPSPHGAITCGGSQVVILILR